MVGLVFVTGSLHLLGFFGEAVTGVRCSYFSEELWELLLPGNTSNPAMFPSPRGDIMTIVFWHNGTLEIPFLFFQRSEPQITEFSAAGTRSPSKDGWPWWPAVLTVTAQGETASPGKRLDFGVNKLG